MLLGREGELAMIEVCATAVAAAARPTIVPVGLPAAARPADAGETAARVIEVVGRAGIGKSALLDAAATTLAARGLRVVRHGTSAPERDLPWSTLIALLEQLEPIARDRLGPASRRHLEAVLAPDADRQPLPHGVAVATRELLGLVTAGAPLALLVDDAHWIDAPSAAVLTFVTRAVAEWPMLLLLARPDEEPAGISPSTATADIWHRIELGGLSIDAVAELVRVTTGQRLHRPLLLDVVDCSAGHPQLVVEIAGELAAGVDHRHAVRRRVAPGAVAELLAGLPAATVAVLEHVALTPRPTVGALAGVTGTDDVLAAVAAAETAGLVRVVASDDDLLVRLDPPSVAVLIERRMSTARRREVHLRLAGAATDPIQRAVHLAAARPVPAAGTAADLDAGATQALRLGEPRTAIRLAEAAVAATPADDAEGLRERLLALATAQRHGGLPDEVLATLDRVEVAERSADAARVAVLRAPALAEHSLEGAIEVARDATTWIASGPLRATAFRQVTALERQRDMRAGAAAAERSAAAALADGSASWITTATLSVATTRALIGEAADVDHAIEIAADPRSAGSETVGELLQLLWFTGDPRGVGCAERAIAAAVVAGAAVDQFNAELYLTNMLISRGGWQRAEQLLRQMRQYGYPDASERAMLGFLLASTGHADEAVAVWCSIVSAERTRGRANVFQVQAWQAMGAWARGADDAVEQLLRADELAAAVGLRAPRVVPYRRDLVEALVAAGRHDEAFAAAQRLRTVAESTGLACAGADADAADGLLAGTGGDDDRAAELIARAVKVYDRDGERYELARALLTSGRLARRAGRRGDARRDLEAAAAVFAELDARPWLARCATELGRIGGRPRRDSTLTETEQLVAERAAAGESNAEIAAAMFVALRTVESNLSRVYRKLGIRSRAQLAVALAERQRPLSAPN